jgi:hypothetical protein
MIDINDVLIGIGTIMLLWAVSDYVYRHFFRHKKTG